nr:SCO family protein [Halomonas desiderata]
MLVLSLAISSPSFAHSLEDAEAVLHERERYAQFVDQPAPAFALTDVDGNAVTSSDLEGQVVVLNFIYTRCQEACPLHMNLIAQVQDSVNESGLRDEVEFITIATDTEDVGSTRNNMRAYGENFGFDLSNWRFLYRDEGEPTDTTRLLAETYGLKFTEVTEGVQLHGVVTHVIDQSGRMRARFHGLAFDPDHLVSYARVLAEGPETITTSTWDRLRHYVTNIFN